MQSKWQPVVLISNTGRVECGECSALAIFVILDETIGDDGERDFDYSAWCQACFEKAQEETA